MPIGANPDNRSMTTCRAASLQYSINRAAHFADFETHNFRSRSHQNRALFGISRSSNAHKHTNSSSLNSTRIRVLSPILQKVPQHLDNHHRFGAYDKMTRSWL